MVDLRLRPVDDGDETQCLSAHAEMAVEDFPFLLHYDDQTPWPAYVQMLAEYRCGLRLPSGMVPSTFLVAEADGVLVGRTSVRHALNDYLAVAGGHIGYGVLRAFRRRGLATEILRQSLVVARAEGVDRALLTCDIDNVASARVIESAGGVFESVVEDPRGGPPKRRYWIA